jgi:hypothetical protein
MKLTPVAVVIVILFGATGIAGQLTHSAALAWVSLAFLITSVVMATIIAGKRQARRPGGPT